MEDTFDSLHSKQKTFLQGQSNTLDKKFIGLNQLEDVPCWSESQRESLIKIDFDIKELSEQLNNEEHFKIKQENENQEELKSSSKKIFLDRKKTQYTQSPFEKDIRQKFSFYEGKQSYQSDQSRNMGTLSKVEAFQNEFVPNLTQFNKTKLQIFQTSKYDSPIKQQQFQSLISLNLYAKLKMRMQKFFKQNTINGRTLLLNQTIRCQINDLSDYLLLNRQNNCLYQIIHFTEVIKKWIKYCNFPQINAQGSVGFAILFVLTIINSSLLYIYSCLLVYSAQVEWINTFNIFYKVFYFIEILIKLYTGPLIEYKNKDDRTKKEMLLSYLKYNAIFDVIPLISLFYSTYQSSYLLVKIITFIKLINIMKDINKIQKRLCMVIKKYYYVQIFNLILKLFFIGHCIACLWYLIGIIEVKYLGESETWMDQLNQNELTWWKLYIWSIYWSLTLMTTGSNTAFTIPQACFTSIIMLFITIAFGYILNVIGFILQEMDETALQKRKDISLINEYMRIRNISKQFHRSFISLFFTILFYNRGLQAKVNQNLEHYYRKNFQKKQENNNEVLQKISKDLQNQILVEYNKQIFNKISILNNNFSKESLQELTLFVNEEYFFPNQLVLKEDDPNECSMMYIISGSGKFKYLQNLISLFLMGEGLFWIFKMNESLKRMRLSLGRYIN